MREPFRLICAATIGSAMALFGLAGVAIATPANTLNSNVAESDLYLTFRGTVKVKCPVVNLRNEATGEYIWGSGRTKAAAVKDANNKLASQKGRGFKLKHCRQV